MQHVLPLNKRGNRNVNVEVFSLRMKPPGPQEARRTHTFTHLHIHTRTFRRYANVNLKLLIQWQLTRLVPGEPRSRVRAQLAAPPLIRLPPLVHTQEVITAEVERAHAGTFAPVSTLSARFIQPTSTRVSD